jgi:hypothetical protein
LKRADQPTRAGFLDEAAALVESLGETDEETTSEADVLVPQGSEELIALRPASPDRLEIAVLSEDAVDRARGELRVRSQGVIAIVAAAPSVLAQHAEASPPTR